MTEKIPQLTLATDFLTKLGFSTEEIALFLALIRKGPQTLLQLSRLTHLERTKLYRLTESLVRKGLIEEIPENKRRTVRAVDMNSIELLVKQHDLENTFLTNSLSTFRQLITGTGEPTGNSVVYYHGIEGIRQMSWHILRCKGLFRTYSYRFWDDILGAPFVVKLNQELLAQRFQVHDLYSDQYITFKNEWLASGKGKPKGNWDFWESRYLPEKTLTINQNIDVYNDVVSYYYWEGEETFGVEIYNQRVADLHKQMHDILWNMAEKKPDIDWTKKW